jgi:hypothetical protein
MYRMVVLVAAVIVAVVAAPATAGIGPGAPEPPVVAPAAPAPTPAPAACDWLVVGHASNCDNLDPNQIFDSTAWPTACTANNDLITHTVASATLADGSLILLTYAGGHCRTVAASLYAPHYSGSGSCTVTITRSSDSATATASVVSASGFWSAETYALYDAGVSVVASASCTHGGHTYTGKTAPR